MKSAYGYRADPTRLHRGLAVIAHALNLGDMGRAMVAAVQLRLSDLDWEGAKRVAYADDLLNKYNPGEPRDERGRWTTGGAPSANSSAKPLKPTSPPVPVKPTRQAKQPRDLGETPMRPILVSDPIGPPTLKTINSLVVIGALSRQCINNAGESNYYRKTQDCASVARNCEWLIRVNADNPLRRDACLWPDGSAAVMKFGVLVPFKIGHPF
jgi:hypothetical protein